MRLRLASVLIVLAACDGGGSPSGPFDDLPVSGDFTGEGLDGAVHVARDRFGIAHIHGTTVRDVAYAQGYVMAHDRLPQMDILRRFGAGTLGVLFGALDQGVVETDLEMRMHRMKPLAEATWATLQASSSPVDRELVDLLQRFADGVNAYAADLAAGKWNLDDAIESSFDPGRFEAWTPVDSLVLGRFQAFALSWTMPTELDFTELDQGLRATYSGAADPRRGIAKDILQILPIGRRSTIDGFPNVGTDTGTRSDAGRPAKRGAAITRPEVPAELFANAHRFFADGIRTGAFGAYGPHAFMAPHAGSNNWVVGPSLAGGKTLLATDQHLNLPNPSIFYPTHLIVAADGATTTEVMGITFPGIPGVILGTNGKVAWAATVSFHDVNDVYLETIVPCPGGGDCVLHGGQPVPIESRTETIQLGALGTIVSERQATYETGPHGPLIPTIANGQLVPRTAATALSVAYTGYAPTFEIRAIWGLAHAASVDDAFTALADFSYGSQNWAIIDNQGNIGWTTNAKVPLRDPAAYTYNAQTNPTGLAPFFILPGDTGGDWQGFLSSRYVPHAINPASGFLATANADPVGQTFDGDPLGGAGQPIVDGRPLYVGVTYAAGVREERISNLIEAAAASGGAADLAEMAAIQRDTSSTVGAKLRAGMVAALGVLDGPAGQPADAVTYLAGLSPADRTRLADARTLLAAWTFATPAMLGSDPGDTTDTASTALFNAFMHFFIEGILADELGALVPPFSVWRLEENLSARVAYGVLAEPATYVQSAATNQPILCDDRAVAGPDQSCTTLVLRSLLAAMDHLASPAGYGNASSSAWRWGDKHRLTLEPLFPNDALSVPPPSETNPRWQGGFPKAGDNFVINRSDEGWADLDFAQFGDGPAQRFLAEADPGGVIRVKWALPGGVIYDRDSPHYRDLLDQYYIPESHFDAPFAVADIVAQGEDRWVFH